MESAIRVGRSTSGMISCLPDSALETECYGPAMGRGSYGSLWRVVQGPVGDDMVTWYLSTVDPADD